MVIEYKYLVGFFWGGHIIRDISWEIFWMRTGIIYLKIIHRHVRPTTRFQLFSGGTVNKRILFVSNLLVTVGSGLLS